MTHEDSLPPVIAKAYGDTLVDDQGKRYLDLFGGFGACLLGHAQAELVSALTEQIQGPWLLGGLPHPQAQAVTRALEPYLPPGLCFAGLYSTGMEVAELAIRMARAATDRHGVLGFAGSMHGKSLATAHLGWDNQDGVELPGWHRMPFVDRAAEADILEQTYQVLRQGEVGAVFVEVMQGSNGAHEASSAFYGSLAELVRDAGALLVCDEILTGFYRTGPRFRFELHGLQPDAVLIGKAFSNGFPASGLLLRQPLTLVPQMLPGSTYAGNPLACVAVAHTLALIQKLDVERRVREIAGIVTTQLTPLPRGWTLRGAGALWVLDCLTPENCHRLMTASFRGGVCVGGYGKWLRIMPAAIIDPDKLETACNYLANAARGVQCA